MKKHFAVPAVGLLLMSFCGSASACGDRIPPGAEVPLERTIWVLEEFGEPGKLKSPINGTRITLRFEPDSKRVGGSGGCNSYGGAYQLSGQHGLDVKEIIQTEIACWGSINAQETTYFRILSAVTSFELEHRRLTLSGPEGILVFQP